MRTVSSLAEVADLATSRAPLFVRFSAGPEADSSEVSRDHESGCELPGLSVNPLNPEPWFDRPVQHWVARQFVQYAHLGENGRYAWVLAGRVVGRGPDCEPLVADVEPVARIPDEVVREARDLYEDVFDAGQDGT
ncbi:DUF6098 family protein [Isoptericola variabilis]|uniref:Uncharacterized protein n=1 Tax=Isoptericola variabilis (strain 225) TaxID=743718 RepID=F6FQA7_ISOV2|nr:DUF6098 family protein [Isoptericola variabilis]AEG42860.1 hypothetical protein Isova_0042 [Isoptericola variabilis 225]TWH31000.1 hypothetical protein L600_002700000240 [Isoptericola variabilis J7]